mmetsp:Transcript_5295/g.15656  ORF Transcript_5295/g.15656 Transcript_5295/m.15656 type:complete len:208 (+) Transcript_5295:421-1044(+)
MARASAAARLSAGSSTAPYLGLQSPRWSRNATHAWAGASWATAAARALQWPRPGSGSCDLTADSCRPWWPARSSSSACSSCSARPATACQLRQICSPCVAADARLRERAASSASSSTSAAQAATRQASPSGSTLGFGSGGPPAQVSLWSRQCSAWCWRLQYHTFWQRPHFETAFSAQIAHRCSTCSPTLGTESSSWIFSAKRRCADQ